ncbi:helix-turn-helix domain-containing protein [Saccharibacillus sp. CPCC 101409]|uniref:helix-turn-helix domain-containing protein n=1 Tax=Saccharibacillus sp. CPCC 101409 TaxID=3058041 RepID=UPI002670F356|nr:helix-turn-helix domain-containing protein [Saccharibacillus sp. CPCC 101409]MDO3408408.1 helix-turn-helix domain-containing protein [Saccharibacillus sp. CPCC 101409]
MPKSEKNHELKKLFAFAGEFSHMDTVFTGPGKETEWKSIGSRIPQPLQPYLENLRQSLRLDPADADRRIALHSTSFHIHFISVNLFDTGAFIGSIVIGPFLLEEPSAAVMNEIVFANRLPIGLLPTLQQYYLSLPLIARDKADRIADFLAYLAARFDDGRSDSFERTALRSISNPHVVLPEAIKQKATEEAVASIEERYRLENRMMAAVETGNLEKTVKMVEDLSQVVGEIPDRIPNNPLRSRKNLAFVTNTLLRKSAEKGGVHPLYIDGISEKLAIQIEKSSSVRQLLDIQKQMYIEYCEAVRSLSLIDWSPLVKSAIEHIRLHIDRELRLEEIARAIRANPYELSRRFKKETGQPLTSYINAQRIQEAAQLLQNESMTITDIAQMVGFGDVNYFTKVFKQLKGCTPSRFRKPE